MVYGAIDLHMRYSQIRIVDEAGAVLRDQRVLTGRERLVTAFEGYGEITGGPKPFSPKDRSAFLQSLDREIVRLRRQGFSS